MVENKIIYTHVCKYSYECMCVCVCVLQCTNCYYECDNVPKLCFEITYTFYNTMSQCV